MENLKKDWLTEGLIDFEYKKYILLAYFKHVRQSFDHNKLYPFLSDLIFHYQNLASVKDNKKLISMNFPKELTKADFKKLQLSYKKIVEDDEVMKEIEDLVHYAIPRFKSMIREGKEIYQFVESQVEIHPVGLYPIYDKEGYLMIEEYNKPELKVYSYQISVFENQHENFRGINLSFLESQQKSPFYTMEQVKLDLIKRYSQLPNPATYLLQSKMSFPFSSTLLPMAKRLFIRYLTQA